LNAIRVAWAANTNYSVRLAVIRANELASANRADDFFSDSMEGDQNTDWFLADRDSRDGDDDSLPDRVTSETVTQV
jgi:hypothetical protein